MFCPLQPLAADKLHSNNVLAEKPVGKVAGPNLEIPRTLWQPGFPEFIYRQF
jgi:hypothetical protein